MSERYFRIVLGAWLIGALVLNSTPMVLALLALLLFEGVTNLRVPRLLGQLRNGGIEAVESSCAGHFPF